MTFRRESIQLENILVDDESLRENEEADNVEGAEVGVLQQQLVHFLVLRMLHDAFHWGFVGRHASHRVAGERVDGQYRRGKGRQETVDVDVEVLVVEVADQAEDAPVEVAWREGRIPPHSHQCQLGHLLDKHRRISPISEMRLVIFCQNCVHKMELLTKSCIIEDVRQTVGKDKDNNITYS